MIGEMGGYTCQKMQFWRVIKFGKLPCDGNFTVYTGARRSAAFLIRFCTRIIQQRMNVCKGNDPDGPFQLKMEVNPSSFGAIDMTGIGESRTNSWARDPTKNCITLASCWVMIMMRSISPCCSA
jgi:hypothetical protein